ncbi:MAG: LysR family transcriptional regulator [Vitreoscilla sp.]
MHKSGLVELEAVLAVARRASFRGAAIDLAMSTSALSSAIAGLEARLGVRLFNRTTRSVALSEAGERFVAEVAPALAQIRDAMAAASDRATAPRGTLRINTSGGAALMTAPIVHEYLRRYPEMHVDIVTEGRLIDIVAAGHDAGIRLAESVPRDMVSVPMGPALGMAVVGSPAYFQRHPRPKTPADLARHACVRTRLPSGTMWRWEFRKNGQAQAIDVDGPLTLDDMPSTRAAALAGVALAWLSEHWVRDDLARGDLVRVLADWSPSNPGLCLYYPSRRHAPAALRALVELVREMNPRGKAPRQP